jgi:GNAT superfamily N-acetyltransferase
METRRSNEDIPRFFRRFGEGMTDSASYSIVCYPASKAPEAYLAFVYSKWLRSLRYGNPLFKKVLSDEYYKNYETFIKNIMSKPDAFIRFAVLSDDHDILLGFSVNREDVLDYVFVHFDYRKTGIGRSLIPEGITTFTHLTTLALAIWPSNEHYKDWKFNPFA